MRSEDAHEQGRHEGAKQHSASDTNNSVIPCFWLVFSWLDPAADEVKWHEQVICHAPCDAVGLAHPIIYAEVSIG